MGATGKSTFPGPERGVIAWQVQADKISGEPSVGIDGNIYIPLESGDILALNTDGEELWCRPLLGGGGKPLQDISTPAIRADGSLIVAAIGRVACLEPDGELRWEKRIDGLPSSPCINAQGRIFISAWSFDWAGMYVISPAGQSVGLDDPRVKEGWRAGRFVFISAPCVDEEGRVYLAYRDNITPPEAYTWDPIDEVREDYEYRCVIFDTDGKKLGRFSAYRNHHPYPTAVSVSQKGNACYTHPAYPELVCFTLQDVLTDDRQYTEACQWSWDRSRDKDSEGKKGLSYALKPYGYVSLLDDEHVWFRTSKNREPTDVILMMDASEMHTKGRLIHEVRRVSAPVEAEIVIDSLERAYVGSSDGKIHVYDEKAELIKVIDIESPIKALAIGLDSSLIVGTSNQKILMVK